jgi:hypothetical protein
LTVAEIFKAWFGIEMAPAEVLALLYAAGGDLVPSLTLRRTTGATRRAAFKLHEAMEPGSVVCQYAAGYRLSPTGLADCAAALADAQRAAA